MSRLREQVADYLRLRRSLGYKLVEHERMLNQFLDYLEVNQASTITAENALAWARIPAGANQHGTELGSALFVGSLSGRRPSMPTSRSRRPGCCRCAPLKQRPTCTPRTRSAR